MNQIPLALDPPRRRTFDNFAVGRNQVVVDTLRSGLEAAGWYLLTGKSGYGKSHLASALFQCCAPGTALFVPVRDAGPVNFPAMLETADVAVAVVDDIDLIAGSRDGEEALFHALNRWREQGTSVLLTAATLDGFGLPDLRSRLELATRLTLRSPDDDDRRALIEQVAADLGIVLDAGAVNYLLTRGPRNPGRLSERIGALQELARSEQRGVTLPLVRRSLEG